MPEINWLQLVAALLGGGAAGAVITAVVSALRARRQPVGEIGNKKVRGHGSRLVAAHSPVSLLDAHVSFVKAAELEQPGFAGRSAAGR